MRNSTLAIIMISCSLTASAQSIGFTVGVTNWNQVNHIIERYNATRPWLDKAMPQLTTMRGFDIAYDPIFVNEKNVASLSPIRWRHMRNTMSSRAGENVRDIRFTMNTFSLAGYTMYPIRKKGFALGFGVDPLEMSYFKIQTRSSTAPDWNRVFRTSRLFNLPLTTNYSTTLHLDLLRIPPKEQGVGINLRVYYSLFWFDGESIYTLNEEINPETHLEHHQSMTLKNSHFGIVLSLPMVHK